MKQGKGNRVFSRECTSHSKYPLPTTQETMVHMDISRCSTPKSDIIFFAAKDGEALYSQQKQEQEMIVAQIMNHMICPNCQLRT